MVLRRLVALVAVLPAMACSSSDVDDGGAPVSDAGAGGSSAGGASTGGALTTGGETGTGGSSGDAGVSCLGEDGHAPPELAACRVDADCETVTVPTCCGSDVVLGVTDPPSCTLPAPDCTGLGCPKNVHVQTEDGALVEPGFAVAARCDYSGGPSLSQGVCRSYRVPFPDCGSSPCEAGEICVHLRGQRLWRRSKAEGPRVSHWPV